jgi:hypothetical protein
MVFPSRARLPSRFRIFVDVFALSAVAAATVLVSPSALSSAAVSNRGSRRSSTIRVLQTSASHLTSTMVAAPTMWDGQQFTTLITVEARTAGGVALTVGGETVSLITSFGSLSPVKDHDDGRYSAVLMVTELGTATVTGTIAGQPMSASVTVVMHVSTTTTVLAPATSIPGETVTFIAAVSGPLQGPIEGEVVFRDGDTVIGTDQLNGGAARITKSKLAMGTHTITAAYGGSPSRDPSTSPPFTHTVQPPGLTGPTALSATATSTSVVAIHWSGGSGATAYEVHRRADAGPFTLVATSVGTTYNDSGVTADTAYMYVVRAINAAGASAFSPPDLATTIVFTDPVLSGTNIKAVHVAQLRTAVAAIYRTARFFGQAAFNDPVLSRDTPVRAQHMAEMRMLLDQARFTLGLPAIDYADAPATAGGVVKATHLLDLRRGVR